MASSWSFLSFRWCVLSPRALGLSFNKPTPIRVSFGSVIFGNRRCDILKMYCFHRLQSKTNANRRMTSPHAFIDYSFRNAIGFNRCDFSSTSPSDPKKDAPVPTEKLSLLQRYKKMLKEYWYVLIPVHMATSGVWFVSFYYAAKSGVDIVPFMEYLGVPEQYLSPLRSSSLGYLAVATAMYKLATPARYTVTLGTTTMTINYLNKRGLLPMNDDLKKKLKDRKDSVVNRLKSKR